MVRDLMEHQPKSKVIDEDGGPTGRSEAVSVATGAAAALVPSCAGSDGPRTPASLAVLDFLQRLQPAGEGYGPPPGASAPGSR